MDSAHGLPLLSSPRLRVWTPPPSWRQGELPLVDAPPEPEVFLVRLNGRVYAARVWTASEWARTPERPGLILRGARGGRLAIEAEER